MGRQRTLRLVMLGVLLALALGQLLSAAVIREPSTVTARLYGGGGPVYVRGVVIREERLVTAEVPEGYILQVRDGEKVAAGQMLYVRESSRRTAALARRVRILRTGGDTETLTVPARRASVHDAIAALNAAPAVDRAGAGETLTGVMLGQAGDLSAELSDAEEDLRRESAGKREAVPAPAAGVFSAGADGLEEILTPEEPWAGWPLPRAPLPEDAVGRLVTGDTWYFRTELPIPVEAGQTLRGALPGTGEELALTVEETYPGGRTLLSCGRMLPQMAAARQAELKIYPESKSGLEIPARAVYTVEQQTGVWCLVGEAARFKPVTVIEDLGETVVVALDQSTTDNLWPGDRVLLDYR